LNKLDDYIIRLNWYSDKVGDYSLKSLVNIRIAASLPILKKNGWDVIVDDLDKELPDKVKSVWAYIANRTFERPRDIVKFLKCIKKQSTSGKLPFKTVQKAELEYSNWFYNELRDEIHSHLPIWKEALQAVTKVGKGVFPMSELEAKMLQDKQIMTYVESHSLSLNNIAEKLFEFSVLGNLDDRKRWLFKYKDHDMPFDENMKLIVHFGFAKKLRFANFGN